MRERGQSLVELALLLPVLLIILLGLLDLGRAYYVSVALEDMAAEGAAFAAVQPNPGDLSEVQARAAGASTGLVRIEPGAVQVQYPPAIVRGNPVTVTVPFEFTFVTPFISGFVGDGAIELRGIATDALINEL